MGRFDLGWSLFELVQLRLRGPLIITLRVPLFDNLLLSLASFFSMGSLYYLLHLVGGYDDSLTCPKYSMNNCILLSGHVGKTSLNICENQWHKIRNKKK